MPKHWAPCLHVPDAKVLLAEEAIYLPFQLRVPGTCIAYQRALWRGATARQYKRCSSRICTAAGRPRHLPRPDAHLMQRLPTCLPPRPTTPTSRWLHAVFVKQEHRDWFHNLPATYAWQFHVARSTSPDEHNSEYLAFQTSNGQN